MSSYLAEVLRYMGLWCRRLSGYLFHLFMAGISLFLIWGGIYELVTGSSTTNQVAGLLSLMAGGGCMLYTGYQFVGDVMDDIQRGRHRKAVKQYREKGY